jgi:hypothetical protein
MHERAVSATGVFVYFHEPPELRVAPSELGIGAVASGSESGSRNRIMGRGARGHVCARVLRYVPLPHTLAIKKKVKCL